ncbi:MAG: glycosyltransferase family 2 protein [Promethearchaeota archaeon]
MHFINYLDKLELKGKIIEITDNNKEKKIAHPEASVIIVTYNTNQELLSQNLESLKKQFNHNFEIIIVDNSDKRDIKSIALRYTLKYIKLNKNYGLSLARNIGTKYARGDIVIFLDDDAIPADDFIEQHIKAYQINDIIGLRGKAIPINNKNIYNHFSYHYDYGNKTIPCYINLEGNSSFKREELIKIGGLNPKLEGAGGFEGLELSYRIISKFKDLNKLIYYPDAIIYHEYSSNLIKFIRKRLRHIKYSKYLMDNYEDIFKFTENYQLSSKIKKDFRNKDIFFRIKFKLLSYIRDYTKIRNI